MHAEQTLVQPGELKLPSHIGTIVVKGTWLLVRCLNPRRANLLFDSILHYQDYSDASGSRITLRGTRCPGTGVSLTLQDSMAVLEERGALRSSHP